MSLKSDILKVSSEIKTSFHMPGHKYKDIININLKDCDTTELKGTDNLHGAFGCIKDAEDRASRIYLSKKTKFLVAGSSIGIIASIYALANRGDRIIIGRDSHKSVFNACRIADLSYISVMPNLGELGEPLDYPDFYKTLLENKDIKLAVITSPNYYGYIRNFKDIAKEMEKRGGYLIVDEAHGAHLEFTNLKEYSALDQGAHVVIQSAHKTLPAMTMSAMLHYGKSIDNDAIEKVDRALAMFQSSSPSYPLMISIDSALEYMDNNRKEIQSKFDEFKAFELKLFESNLINKSIIANEHIKKDPFKIFINTISLGYTGFEVADLLMDKGIYTEFSQYNGVLLYLSIFNTITELEEAYKILKSLNKRESLVLKAINFPINNKNTIRYRNNDTKYEIIKIDKSLGRVSAEDIIPYPPGVPLLLKGEKISKDILGSLISLSELPSGFIEGKQGKLNEIKVERILT